MHDDAAWLAPVQAMFYDETGRRDAPPSDPLADAERTSDDMWNEAAALLREAHQQAHDRNMGPRGSDLLAAYRIVLEQRRTRAIERLSK